jgi:hypothetical protein
MRNLGIATFSLKALSGQLMLGLMVLAMIYRGVIPVGYMLSPDHSSTNKVMIELCVANGSMVIPFDIVGQQSAPTSDHDSVLTCPFAMVAAQYLVPDTAPIVALSRVFLHPVSFAGAAARVSRASFEPRLMLYMLP